MRLWSVHPRYLDTKGLVAGWREGLLALSVIDNPKRGYHNHSQLVRFKKYGGKQAIGAYLKGLFEESLVRGFKFNPDKLSAFKPAELSASLPVTKGQFEYESEWLQKKLVNRDPNMWQSNYREGIIEPHPIFYIVDGSVEYWEKQSD